MDVDGASEQQQNDPFKTPTRQQNPPPLFVNGTPSPLGIPRGPGGEKGILSSSPLRNVAARRALGLTTPKNPSRLSEFGNTTNGHLSDLQL